MIDDFLTNAADDRLFLRTVLLPDGVNDTEGDGDARALLARGTKPQWVILIYSPLLVG